MKQRLDEAKLTKRTKVTGNANHILEVSKMCFVNRDSFRFRREMEAQHAGGANGQVKALITGRNDGITPILRVS